MPDLVLPQVLLFLEALLSLSNAEHHITRLFVSLVVLPSIITLGWVSAFVAAWVITGTKFRNYDRRMLCFIALCYFPFILLAVDTYYLAGRDNVTLILAHTAAFMFSVYFLLTPINLLGRAGFHQADLRADVFDPTVFLMLSLLWCSLYAALALLAVHFERKLFMLLFFLAVFFPLIGVAFVGYYAFLPYI